MITTHTARRAVALAAAGAGLTAAAGVGTNVAHAGPHAIATAPVVHVTVKAHTIKVAGGTTIQPGRKIFDVKAKGRSHTLQILKLHKGYSAKQLQHDVPRALKKGDVHAIRRLDHKVTWLGGSASKKNKTSEFAVTLAPGKYFGVDQDGPAFTKLKVAGTPQPGTVPTTATVTGTDKDTWKSPKVLPADGWIKLHNTSDEAHFFALLEVKKSTTKKDVRKFIKSGSGNPKWALKPNTDSGLFSRHTNVAFHVQMPTGKYLMACFWPSEKNGMPHFAMGMWKLVHLK
jgi:hypothetical protein